MFIVWGVCVFQSKRNKSDLQILLPVSHGIVMRFHKILDGLNRLNHQTYYILHRLKTAMGMRNPQQHNVKSSSYEVNLINALYALHHETNWMQHNRMKFNQWTDCNIFGTFFATLSLSGYSLADRIMRTVNYSD